MITDLPQCDFNNCKFYQDGNCVKISEYNKCAYRASKNNKFQVEWSQTIDSFNINGNHTYGYGITIEKFEDGTLVPNIHYNSPHEGGALLSCEKNPSEQYRERFKNYFELAVAEEGEYWNIASRMILRKYNLEDYIND